MSLARCIAVVAIACALSSTTIAQVAGFRIETEVYQDDSQEPFSENLTLFTPEAVYDFMLTGPKEIVIFDAKRGRFTLLDEKRRVRAHVATDQLYDLAREMKARILSGPADKHYLAEPNFEEEFDGDKKELILASEMATYRVLGAPPVDESAGRRWRNFADWSAHLNATRPGPAPFARLALNEAIAQRSLIPRQVELTLVMPGRLFNRQVRLRSEHRVAWRLIASDEDRIDEADTYSVSFKEVSLEEFRRLDAKSAAGR